MVSNYCASVLLVIVLCQLLPASSVLFFQRELRSSAPAVSKSVQRARECPTGRSRVLTSALVWRTLQEGYARYLFGVSRRGDRSSRVLDLSGCPLSQISRDAFDPLITAQNALSKSSNANGSSKNISTSPKIRAALGVRVIDLSDSRLDRVMRGAFHDMQHLRSIRLTSSQNLRFISDGAFERLPGLRVLDVSHSPRLEYISPAAFQQTPKLRLLLLRNCSSLLGLQVPDFIFQKPPTILLSSPKPKAVAGALSNSERGLVTVDLRSSSGLLCKCELLALFATTRVFLNQSSQCILEDAISYSDSRNSLQTQNQRRQQLEDLRAGRATDCDCRPHAVVMPLGPISSSYAATRTITAPKTPTGGRSFSRKRTPILKLTARAGRRVALACRTFEAQNTSLEWSWKSLHRGSNASRQIASSQNAGLLVLQFKSLRTAHAGLYTCTAASNCGAHSTAVRLVVKKALQRELMDRTHKRFTLFPLQ